MRKRLAIAQDALLGPKLSNLILLEHLVRSVRVFVLLAVLPGHDPGYVLASILEDDVVAARMVIDEL
jgi:hypothetical protein